MEQVDWYNKIYQGNVLDGFPEIPDESVNCIVTSPPYWGLRNYGVDGQIGLEKTPEQYVKRIVEIFGKVRRVLSKDGVVWLNLGDSYAGSMKGSNGDGTWQDRSNTKQGTNKGALNLPPQKANEIGLKPKDLIGIPWRVAFALQFDGWYLRQCVIWHKKNPMPESVKDRCVTAHEYIFLLTKSSKYWFDYKAIQEPSVTYENRKSGVARDRENGYNSKADLVHGNAEFYDVPLKRNKRSVWTTSTKPFKGAHFAVFPEDLILPCVLAGCPEGGVVFDPFMGAGTTAVVAKKNNRNYVGYELNSDYIKLAEERIEKV